VNRTAARIRPLFPVALTLWLAACGGDDPARPYVEFLGGGFIFNYRLAEADYGFVVKPLRTIPPGTALEALFEDPAGGPPLRVRQTARSGMLQYSFRSPPVTGVVAGRPYRVELRLLDAATGAELARYERSFTADVGQEVLPATPPVVGPGYQPNPEAGR
jgi:hypothetical protein